MNEHWNKFRNNLNEIKNSHAKFVIIKKTFESLGLILSKELKFKLANEIAVIETLLKNSNKDAEKKILLLEEELTKNIYNIFDSIPEDMHKVKIVFFPYKTSMWSSLESVYLAAKRNKQLDVKIVPLPYYEKQNNYNLIYEGDMFEQYYKEDYVHYTEFSFVDPVDIGFVHNVYDKYNTLTMVHPAFHTKELKKNIQELVFIPYHVSTFLKGQTVNYLALTPPSVRLVDKIIVSGRNVKDAALSMGIDKIKVHDLGSPQFDGIKENERKNIGTKKKVLLNTGCLFFNNNATKKINILTDLFRAVTNSEQSYEITWRPHPLTSAHLNSLPDPEKAEVDLLFYEIERANIYKNVSIDNSSDYVSVLNDSDVLISNDGSLLRLFMKTQKPIIFFDENNNKRDINKEICNDVFFTVDENYGLYQSLENIDYDHPKMTNLKNLVESSYSNLNKNIGEEILNFVLKK